jgi:hypothetical protein
MKRHVEQDITEGFDPKPDSLMAEYRRLREQAIEASARAEAVTAEWANAKRNVEQASLELTAAYEDDTSAADLRKLETKLANARKVLEKPWEERAKGAQGSADHAREDLYRFKAENADGLLAEILPACQAWREEELPAGIEVIEILLANRARLEKAVRLVMADKPGVDPRRDLASWNVPSSVRDGLRDLRDAPAPVPRPAPTIST